MRNSIYNLRVNISSVFLEIALRLNSHYICALIILFNIRRLIKSKNKTNIKRILVFPKSGGNEDLIETYKNKKNNNIDFIVIPRGILKKIYKFFFQGYTKRDYFTKLNGPNEIDKKNFYIKFLIQTFSQLDKFIKFDGFISFNLFYFAEKYFDEISLKLNKKFFVLHKESTFTPIEELNALKIYAKNNDKSNAKISVYSESQKTILIKSKIANKKQIIVNGCPRSDYSFKVRKIKPQNKTIVFYLIEKDRGNTIMNNKIKINWSNLYYQTVSYLIDYAKNNSEVKVIFKGKTGVHFKDFKNKKILPKNCIFIDGGTGEKFLKDAKIVIAFNSTIVFEAIAGNRNLIIPNFNKENIKKKDLVYNIQNSSYFANSKSQFYKKLNYFLNIKYKNRKLINIEKKILSYYLGNIDGKSGKRLENYLKKNIN